MNLYPSARLREPRQRLISCGAQMNHTPLRSSPSVSEPSDSKEPCSCWLLAKVVMVSSSNMTVRWIECRVRRCLDPKLMPVKQINGLSHSRFGDHSASLSTTIHPQGASILTIAAVKTTHLPLPLVTCRVSSRQAFSASMHTWSLCKIIISLPTSQS